MLFQLLLPEGGHRLSVLARQGFEHGIPVSALLGLGQLQQEGDIFRVRTQGGKNGGTYILLGLGENFPEPGGGLRPLNGGDHLHPANHSPVSGGIKVLLQQGQGSGTKFLHNCGVELADLPITVPQTGSQGGQNPVIGKKFRVILPGGLDDLHPPASGGGEGGQQRVELAVGQFQIPSLSGRHGGQFPLHTGSALGVGHRVHQSQQVQQKPGPLRCRGGQQLGKARVNLSKYRAGPGQRL